MTDNIPPSQMLRVPTPLVDTVKELSRLHRAGYSSSILTGLQQLIARLDSNIDITVNVAGNKSDSEVIATLISNIDERIARQLAPIEVRLDQSIKELVTEKLTDNLDHYQQQVFSFARDLSENLLNLLQPLQQQIEQVESRLHLIESNTAIKSESVSESVVADAASELAVEEPAAIAVVENLQLTRQQLGKRFGKSHETIRQWEDSGKLLGRGWELVPGSGSSPKNPCLYRPISE